MAHDEIRLQLGAPEIEVPVLEAQLFGGQLFALAARHRDRGCLGRTDDLERGRVHFDVPRRELAVAHRRRAGDDLTLHHDDRFRAHGLGT